MRRFFRFQTVPCLLLFLLLLCSCRAVPPGGHVGGTPTPPDVSQTQPPAYSEPGDSSQTQTPEPTVSPETPVPTPQPEPEPEPEPPQPSNYTLHILMYHDVVDADPSACNDWMTTPQQLRQDLQWLKDHGYTTVLPSQLAAGEPLPQRAVMITFDDGYASNYTLAYPLLQEFHAKAVISLITRSVEEQDPGYLTWDMCRQMSASGLVEFGSHTYDSHGDNQRGIKRTQGESQQAYLQRIPPDLQTSIDLIQSHVGKKVLFFAYPNGQTESWANDFLTQHFAVTVTTRHGAANISDGLYNLPRYNINTKQPPSKFLPD